MPVSITGTAFGTSPTISPVAIAIQDAQPTWQTITVQRAGEAVTWDGTTSISGADVDPALTYLWSDQTGGGGLTFSSSTASQPTISCASFGEYIVRLAVTDADAGTDSVDVTIGCVETDDLYRVTYADPDVGFLLGPMIMWGKSPWPYIDERHVVYADYYGGLAVSKTAPNHSDDWNTNLAGTVSVTNGDATVTGSGTSFQDRYCSGGSTPDNPAGGMRIVIHDAAGQDWAYTISSCTSQTSLELTITYTAATDSALNHSRWSDCRGCWVGGSNNNNYYDNVLALYALHYRTGLTIYRTQARALAVTWDDMPSINSGFGAETAGNNIAARQWSFTGLALWARESGQPNAWWDNWDARMAIWEASADSTADFTDVREDGYAFAFVAIMARMHYDSAERTASAAVLTSALGATKRFITTDYKINDVWSNSAFGANCGGTSTTVTNGSTAVVGVGTSWLSISNIADNWLGVGPLGSTERRDITVNDTMRIASAPSNTSITLENNWPGATQTTTTGECRINNVVGTGTQPFQLAMGMAAMDWADDVLGGNATAVDELLDAAEWYDTYGHDDTLRGAYYARAFPNCEPDPQDLTNGGTNCGITAGTGFRFLHLEFIRAVSRAYIAAVENGDPRAGALLTLGDRIVGASLDGGFGGPETDGTWPTELDETDGVPTDKAKNFGFVWCWGGAWSWPAARLAAVTETATTITGKVTISGAVTF
ncbi:MAG: hypothetical protein O3A53_19035 [Acidobacteria bacterium]|nr:hypothetical protein [Acidobacteriota bacterium]MDA1236881.1 hypothetical protein [Acidobacteriota bacterium]